MMFHVFLSLMIVVCVCVCVKMLNSSKLCVCVFDHPYHGMCLCF